MSFAMIVYLIGVLSPLKGALLFLSIASFVVGGICLIAALISEEEMNTAFARRREVGEGDLRWHKTSMNAVKVCAWVFLTTMFANILAPSTDTAYVMVAAYGVEGIVTDDRVQQIGGKSLDVIEQWLDEMAPAKPAEN